uniref:tRNA/rRNA methyltransferase (SpoU):RNA methyltransferase TrmH n=1 Tax=Paulinella chromatophora TaxID=39717 RepID=B1X411_PAUCH|nr:tRNA/rRNA methyltransferase (SpoU):RNA methyltransferase TrmH [Paulinella chromatophora]ACB42680.1 tRNA/rRNA methyltransferase (SpoU):RNA methyltransferase TrmH [Paulinella chromatophora]
MKGQRFTYHRDTPSRAQSLDRERKNENKRKIDNPTKKESISEISQKPYSKQKLRDRDIDKKKTYDSFYRSNEQFDRSNQKQGNREIVDNVDSNYNLRKIIRKNDSFATESSIGNTSRLRRDGPKGKATREMITSNRIFSKKIGRTIGKSEKNYHVRSFSNKSQDLDTSTYFSFINDSNYDSLEKSSETEKDLIWGRHSTQAALESGRPIHRIWCTSEVKSSSKFLQLLKKVKASSVLVEEVSWARLGQLIGGSGHQGIALQMAAVETLDLTKLIEDCCHLGENPLLMAVEGLTDPHNLGAIVRSAEALGAHGLILPQRRNAGLTGSVAKVAAGALEHLPVARVVNLNRSLDILKDKGYRIVGLATEGDVSLTEADLNGPLVIVTGSEGNGLSLLTRRYCDQLIRIPLRGATPSLNASVASALMLYEVARRTWMKDLGGQSPVPQMVRPSIAGQTLSSNQKQEISSSLVVNDLNSQKEFMVPTTKSCKLQDLEKTVTPFQRSTYTNNQRILKSDSRLLSRFAHNVEL